MKLKVFYKDDQLFDLLRILRKHNCIYKTIEIFKGYDLLDKYIIIYDTNKFFYKEIKNFDVIIFSYIKIYSNIEIQKNSNLIKFLNENKYLYEIKNDYLYVRNPDVKLLDYLEKNDIQFDEI